MALSGFVPETYIDESCIRAADQAAAVSKFTLPSGTYDIIASYAGGEEGPGSLALSVTGSEKLAWKWEAGTGSWKRKTIPQVSMQTGDQIKISGSAGARVDFLEIVPAK